MRDRICIILLNWNGKADTLECLSSLSKVDYPYLSTIVVDNGSSDGSIEAIRSTFPETPIFETGKNLGFAGGNNVGIEWALGKPFKWILLLNNDTIVAPDLLHAFMKCAHEHPEAKIFGAKIYRYAEPNCIDHLGGTWNRSNATFDSLAYGQIDDQISYEKSESVDYVCGAALLMHREVPETIGLLESRYFLFWEETDFCFRARRKGFDIRTAPQAKVWHKVSASFIGGKPHAHYFWWRSRLLWLERNLPTSDRKQVMKTIIRPELLKMTRHYFLRLFQQILRNLFRLPTDPERRQHMRRLKAGIAGTLHYYLKKFGNCPPWVSKG